MATVLKLEQQLGEAWDDPLFAQQYLAAVAEEGRLIAQHDSFAEWLSHLHDAFELVDWRSGETCAELAEVSAIQTQQPGCWRKPLRR